MIELLKKVLMDAHRDGMEYKPLLSRNNHWKMRILKTVDKYLRTKGFAVTRLNPIKSKKNRTRKWWPLNAETMLGMDKMDNIEYCIRNIAKNKIEGDIIECGVWRGGACIFMKALVNELSLNKTVFVADSFEGLPKPTYKEDEGDIHYTFDELFVSLEEVQNNFKKYDLLDDSVQFLKGWFKDTLHKAPIEKLALLRADGDMYESTMDILTALYPKLTKGGYCIIDDYNVVDGCKKAVNDYRAEHSISDEIIIIDEGCYWEKG